MGRNSSQLTYNNILQTNLKPARMYSVQLKSCTKKRNINITQRFQNKILRNIINAAWLVGSSDLHKDLGLANFWAIDQINQKVTNENTRKDYTSMKSHNW